MSRATGLLTLVVIAGCGTSCSIGPSEDDSAETDTESGVDGEFEALIDHSRWVQIDAEDDPLADHRPAEVGCGVAGWYVEDEDLEIDTNFCNYLAISQPSLVAIEQGRGVRLGFYHFNLTSIDPALAHVALVVDKAILWEREIQIPGDAAVYELEFEAPFSAPAGSDLVFHLHNHGQNTWALRNLSAEQPALP